MNARFLLAAATGLLTAATAQVKLPSYTRQVLPNGATVVTMPRPGVPLVHFRVMIRGGVESDPRQLPDLAAVTGSLLRRGTAKRSAAQFAEELDSLGGTFNSASDLPLGSATALTAEFLAKDFNRGLDLLADAILQPAFPESEVQKELSRAADAVRAAKDNPQVAIGFYFQPFFFGRQHPYGNPPDEASYAHMRRQDIVEYHQKAYCGKNLLIVAAGDVDSAASAKLGRAFGAAPAGAAFVPASIAAAPVVRRALLIDKPDATQTYFEIALPGIPRNSPDRTVLELVNTLFGGRFTSILNDELRVNAGLTYGANSRLDAARLPGAIAINTYTKTETTVQAIDLALDVLKRFQERGVTAEQLASAKAYVKGLYPTRSLETVDQIAAAIGLIETYGLGKDEVDGLFARIDAVTLDRANAAVRKYYSGETLTFVILGAAAKIRDGVKKYTPQLTEISVKDPGWSK